MSQLVRRRSCDSLLRLALLSFAIHGFAVHGEEITLQVIPRSAPDPSSVSVELSAGFAGRSTDSSSISGEITLFVEPSFDQIETAQIVDMHLTLDDAISFRLASGLVRASSAAGQLKLDLFEPGEAASVTNGAFVQLNNLIALSGGISVSVDPDPIDLAELTPTAVDFQSVLIERSGNTVMLSSFLETQVVFPVDTGILGEIDVIANISGGILALGELPSLNGFQWSPSSLPMGGVSFAWASMGNWLKDGATAGRLPSISDRITFDPQGLEEALYVIDLGGDSQDIAAADFHGRYSIRNGSLVVHAGEVTISSLVDIGEDAALQAESDIEIKGVGDFLIQGSASALRGTTGVRIGGTGQIAALHVEPDATLLVAPGVATEARPLLIEGPLVIDGEMAIVAAFPDDVTPLESSLAPYADPVVSDERHTRLLVEAGTIEVSGLDDVLYESASMTAEGNGVYSLHAGEGLFRTITFAATTVVLENYRARPGDVDGGGKVDFADFLVLSNAFGSDGDWLRGDFDHDGLVAFPDFLALSASFGSTSAIAVPAPSSHVLLLLGAFVAQGRGRRRTNA